MLRVIFAAITAVLIPLTMASAQETATQTEQVIEVTEMVQGADDAPVTLVEYASFTCPHCASFHAGPYKSLKTDYIDTGKVKFIFREVYFDRFGLWASMIARCAGPDRFFGVTDLMFASQSKWARAGDANEIVAELRKVGRMAGMDEAGLDSCLQDADKAQALVNWYQKNATEDNIRSTPSFLLNGKAQANVSYAELSKLIDAELAK